MKKYPLVLDLETKYTFRQANDPKKLGISVVGIYDYQTKTTRVFLEKELRELFSRLEKTSYIIGFNIRSFDMQVLQAYYPGNITHFAIFDILEDIKTKIGRRLALNDIIFATLAKKKTGHGLMAINYFQENKWEELKKYCLSDVILTKELFDYGVKNGEVFYLNEKGKIAIKVDWKKYLEDVRNKDMPLTLPF